MRLLLLFLLIPALSDASVFSSWGYGEYVNFGTAGERAMGGVRLFSVPKSHIFEATLISGFIRIKDKNNIRDDYQIALSTVRYFLPLPKSSGIAISLSNLLSTNFYIESEDIYYNREVRGKGGIGEFSLSLYRKFPDYSIGIGGLLAFGRTEEVWETIFPDYDNTIDTLITTCSEYGIIAQFASRYKNTDISIGSSHYFNSARLPTRFSLSFLHNPAANWNIGGGVDIGLWREFSPNINLGLGFSRAIGSVSVMGGVFSRSWYFRDIHEIGGSGGLKFLYPDGISSFSMGLEFGRRGWEDIEERFMRLSFTLLGTEMW